MFFTINDEVKSELAIECEHKAYEIFLERCKRLSLYPTIYRYKDRLCLYWHDVYWNSTLRNVLGALCDVLIEDHYDERGYRFCLRRVDSSGHSEQETNSGICYFSVTDAGIILPADSKKIAEGVSPLG